MDDTINDLNFYSFGMFFVVFGVLNFQVLLSTYIRNEDGRPFLPCILPAKLWSDTWIQFDNDILFNINIECSLICKLQFVL